MTRDDYDAEDDYWKSWALAVRETRLQGIREGRFAPNLDDAEEMAVATAAGWVVVDFPSSHRVSA